MRKFVLVWSSYTARPGFVDLRDSFNAEELKGGTLGFGAENVRMFAVAPDGKALAQLGGFWSPEHVVPFLHLARTIDASRAKETHAKAVAELDERIKREQDGERVAVLTLLKAWHERDAGEAPRHIESHLKMIAAAALQRGC